MSPLKVYVTHDRNRNGEAPVNGVYQLASFTRCHR